MKKIIMYVGLVLVLLTGALSAPRTENRLVSQRKKLFGNVLPVPPQNFMSLRAQRGQRLLLTDQRRPVVRKACILDDYLRDAKMGTTLSYDFLKQLAHGFQRITYSNQSKSFRFSADTTRIDYTKSQVEYAFTRVTIEFNHFLTSAATLLNWMEFPNQHVSNRQGHAINRAAAVLGVGNDMISKYDFPSIIVSLKAKVEGVKTFFRGVTAHKEQLLAAFEDGQRVQVVEVETKINIEDRIPSSHQGMRSIACPSPRRSATPFRGISFVEDDSDDSEFDAYDRYDEGDEGDESDEDEMIGFIRSNRSRFDSVADPVGRASGIASPLPRRVVTSNLVNRLESSLRREFVTPSFGGTGAFSAPSPEPFRISISPPSRP